MSPDEDDDGDDEQDDGAEREGIDGDDGDEPMTGSKGGTSPPLLVRCRPPRPSLWMPHRLYHLANMSGNVN
jgi:hypothetical protein